MAYLIVGVTGHIDHGKTSLVKVLTGVDTDTHPEEKLRGITIDLGFASFCYGNHEFALIDAPGHQKYIGNLLSGVARVDVGLLLVAADQGIQAQTLEHAAILRALGVRELIVAISRSDLVGEEKRSELAEELELFLAEIGYSDFPCVAVSSKTHEGLDSLKSELVQVAERSDSAKTTQLANLPFRMPIDRSFSVTGRGWVVAGTIWSGKVSVGDSLAIAQTGQIARVRELEHHGVSKSEAFPGLRTSLNLVGLTDKISRGDELVAPGQFPTTRRIVAELSVFPDAQEISCPGDAQLHSATGCVSATITGVRSLVANTTNIVVLNLRESIVATTGQSILLRRPYPVGSFAGGRVLADISTQATGAQKHRLQDLREFGQGLVDSHQQPAVQLRCWLELLGELAFDADWLVRHLQIPALQSAEVFAQTGKDPEVTSLPGRLIASSRLERVKKFTMSQLRQATHATANAQSDLWLVEDSIKQRASHLASAATIQLALEDLEKSGQIVRFRSMVAEANQRNQLSKKQRAMLNEIVQQFEVSRSPPTTKELADQYQVQVSTIDSLLRFGIHQGAILDLANGFLFSNTQFQQLCRELASLFQQNAPQPLSVAEIRDAWQLTRKHVIPLLEYCDRQAITLRQGNDRVAGPNLTLLLQSEVLTAETKVHLGN